MSYSAPFYELSGGAYSSITPEPLPPTLFDEETTQDNFGTQSSSWPTSLVSHPPSTRRDVDYEYVNSEMDMDSTGNVESVSTSPISNSTMPDDWVEVPAPFDQLSQMGPPMHPGSADLLWPMDHETGMIPFDQVPTSSIQTPLIYQDTHPHFDDPGPASQHQSYQRPQFPHGATSYLRQSPAHDPWSPTHPRGNVPSGSDVVLFDPSADAGMRHGFPAPTALGEPSLLANPYALHTTSDYGSPLSTNSMAVGISISPSDHTPYIGNNVNFTVTTPEYQSSQPMIKTDSGNSSNMVFPSGSQSPRVALSADHSTERQLQLPQNVPVPGTAYSYASSSSSSSPSMSHNVLTPQRPSESPGPDVKVQPRPTHRSIRTISHNRPGGRPLGSHLQPTVAADANRMRKVVACWHCVLQRDKCGPGNVCERCRKRLLRPNTEFGLGCCRTSVRDLYAYFLPNLVTAMHEPDALKTFCSKHIERWGNVEVPIKLACGLDLPHFVCPVYEFTPLDNELLCSYHYRTDPSSGQYVREDKWSPPLGLQQLGVKDEQVYDRFISLIITSYLPAFARTLYAGEKNDFALRLFQLMISLKLQDAKEARLLKDVFRLIVVSYIMDHTFAIVDEHRDVLFSKLRWQPPSTYPRYCSPRMATRQIKFFFCKLHRKAVHDVLNKLQQIFHSSGKGSSRWTEAFCAVLGLAIASEEVQRSVHITMNAKATAGEFSKDTANSLAEDACREIDQRFLFVMSIFKWKYRRIDSPLTDWNQDWSTKMKDPSVVDFTKNIVSLVKEKYEYLQTRQFVDISEGTCAKYSSRLVARFLLSFWSPT